MNKIDITVGVIILLFILWVLIEKNKTDNTKPVIGDNSPLIAVKSFKSMGDCGYRNDIYIAVNSIGDCGESNGFIGVKSLKSLGDCGESNRKSIKNSLEFVELKSESIIGKETKMSNISGSSNNYLGLDTNKHNTK